MSITIRPAGPEDVAAIDRLIRALAVYEKLEHECRSSPEALARHLFGERAFAEVRVAERDGDVVAMALFFHTFSTFECAPSLYLEDLFVAPEQRGQGIGRALLGHLAALAVERGCRRLEWSVLDWNEPAIRFYRRLGARPMDDWTVFRVDGDALVALAAE